jgi:EAL domain-containing protein (putative c-di-GMP-specific phosphodiesterase class I)
MDDFGKGYSSLSYLNQFPFDTLKIDRSFIAQMGVGGEHTEIVRTIISLANHLGLDVVAEGVETERQLTLLQELGCQFGQGFFLSRPLNSEAAGTLLAKPPRLVGCDSHGLTLISYPGQAVSQPTRHRRTTVERRLGRTPLVYVGGPA